MPSTPLVRRLTVATLLVPTAVIGLAAPASAHGAAGRAELPLPEWLTLWSGVIVALVTAQVLRRGAALPAAPPEGTALPAGLQRLRTPAVVLGRAVGLGLLVATLYAGLLGNDRVLTGISAPMVYVILRVGTPVLCVLLGDVWRLLDPIDTLAAGLQRLGIGPLRPSDRPPTWTAPVLLGSYFWLELAYHDPASPRSIGTWLMLYLVASMTGVLLWGRAWVRQGDGFAALFDLLGRIGPMWSDADGTLRIGWPGSRLSATPRTGSVAAIVVLLLTTTAFDEIIDTQLWADVVDDRIGWPLSAVHTLGLAGAVMVMTLVCWIAVKATAAIGEREEGEVAVRFAPTLVPLAAGLMVAHFLSLLVVEGQLLLSRASDPFGQGWDLFGTRTWRVEPEVIPLGVLVWIELIAILAGTAGSVVAADRFARRWWSNNRARAELAATPVIGLIALLVFGGLYLLIEA